ncbi:MAG: hypothetical protein H8D87_04255 [Deltaproteobacteria bacterium]|uniref:hypothetical protein n=1 Tax=Desulfobacula sp. TaxID=2593537 RepID=UPI001988D6AC|nr:hypothetical protein [Candidatus Desulfobacula maris]MBL6994992.1 hypothetical protein [Desulfobacula sp.]
MSNETIAKKELLLKKRPSAIHTLYNGFRKGKFKGKIRTEWSNMVAVWPDIVLNRKHLNDFTDLCGLERSDRLPILYPFSLLYPLNLWIISQKEIEVPMFKMLTLRNSTVMYRDISVGEKLRITSLMKGRRFVRKGMEFYIESTIQSNDESVWKNTSTFFVPGMLGEEDTTFTSSGLETIPEAETLSEWFLPAKNSFRFARIMGDSNGIHYSKWYARMMGFKRDFVQPIKVSSKCIDCLPKLLGDGPLLLELNFKGPVYYESELVLKNVGTENSNRFDLYTLSNDRPCICGKLEKL